MADRTNPPWTSLEPWCFRGDAGEDRTHHRLMASCPLAPDRPCEPDGLLEVERERDALRAALVRLVCDIDDWNDAVIKIIGRPPNWSWSALEQARALLEGKNP